MRTFRMSTDTARRPLFIDFDAYTDGDPEFKKEITDLMIDNLQEMQQVLQIASKQNDLALFQKVCHKIKATLDMLEDKELLEVVAQLKISMADAELVKLLDRLCIDIIASLNESK
ncbi:hypothetical protein [Ohtaekwangia koreensis]|uniref:HPt domain-containing protein n=1 Tax=Ohtaekwangia koreensis TaxID=688867 RepID=A0A1T5JSK3_9BACT|nr:hypothetical protein [Ohtaekwangia koreensis]SKC54417.1 hypothetical protein SAMN05660236_1443 [Ohtaekwangia koreensis]